MPKPYRSRSRLVLDILHAIGDEGEVGVTRLLLLANLSHPRLQEHLEEMEGKGWIEPRPDANRTLWSLRPEGHEVLRELRRVDEAMKDFGLGL